MLSYRNNLSPPKRSPPGQRALVRHDARIATHKQRQASRKPSVQVRAEARADALAEDFRQLRQEIGADAQRRVLAEAFKDGAIAFEDFKAQLRDIRQRVRAQERP